MRRVRSYRHSETQGHTEAVKWPRHIGILNDYVRVPYANGSSFASQFLYREFSSRGHDVTVIGPKDPSAQKAELPRNSVCLPSVPLRNHPGVYIPFPGRSALREVADLGLDVAVGQTNTAMMDLGVWIRRTQGVPFVCVNTVHLPSVYNVVLPDALEANPRVRAIFADGIMPWAERQVAETYNQGDGLIVLSSGLVPYWRERGVKVPIHVIPRSVDPKVFDVPPGDDPFAPEAERGHRLLVVCRHTREKSVARLLEIFARWVAPVSPKATLTLVGDGPDHDEFKALAEKLGIADRTFFPGEFPVTQMARWYRHADVFVYTSLSETYGQVVSEALWCGLPVVAFADDMGVSQQIVDGENGILVRPGPDPETCNWRFGSEVLGLLRHREHRTAFAARAQRLARERSAPERCVRSYYEAFAEGREHLLSTRGTRSSAARPLAHWTGLHSVLAVLGCLRPPAVVNRHGRRQPGWEELDATPRRIATAKAIVEQLPTVGA